MGRQREDAAFGCRRSAGTLSRSMLVTCERLLSPTLICSRASAKVRFEEVDLPLAEKTATGSCGSCRSPAVTERRLPYPEPTFDGDY
jgi:hypothetical protein